MFEIGNSLREARRRRGLDMAACEQATRIRAKYLVALEEEHFDMLPAPAYCRAFLRSYADFLGLDGDRILDEYSSRFEPESDRMAEVRAAAEQRMARRRRFLPLPPKPRPGGRRGGGAWQLVWIVMGGAGAIALLVWAGASGRDTSPTAIPAPPTGSTVAVAPPVTAPPPAPPPPAPPPGVGLALTGAGDGGSYVQVRRSGPEGEIVYEGTLLPGDRRSWRDRNGLWMRVGWTPGLEVRINGRRVPAEGGTVNFLVTKEGLSPG